MILLASFTDEKLAIAVQLMPDWLQCDLNEAIG